MRARGLCWVSEQFQLFSVVVFVRPAIAAAAETPARRRWLVTQVVGAAPTSTTGIDYGGQTQIATALPVSMVSQTNCSSRWESVKFVLRFHMCREGKKLFFGLIRAKMKMCPH